MEQTNFISLIKTQTNKLVDAWNGNRKDVTAVLADMQAVIAIYLYLYSGDAEQLNIVSNLDEKHPLYELCSYAQSLFDMERELAAGGFDDERKIELEDARAFILSKIDLLHVPVL